MADAATLVFVPNDGWTGTGGDSVFVYQDDAGAWMAAVDDQWIPMPDDWMANGSIHQQSPDAVPEDGTQEPAVDPAAASADESEANYSDLFASDSEGAASTNDVADSTLARSTTAYVAVSLEIFEDGSPDADASSIWFSAPGGTVRPHVPELLRGQVRGETIAWRREGPVLSAALLSDAVALGSSRWTSFDLLVWLVAEDEAEAVLKISRSRDLALDNADRPIPVSGMDDRGVGHAVLHFEQRDGGDVLSAANVVLPENKLPLAFTFADNGLRLSTEREQEERSAVKIQSVFRGHEARKGVQASPTISDAGPENVQVDEEEAKAATKIQAGFRGKQARKEVEAKREEREQTEAATKIQAGFRGKQARKEVQATKRRPAPPGASKSRAPAPGRRAPERKKKAAQDEQASATKIQAAFRGQQARKELSQKDAPPTNRPPTSGSTRPGTSRSHSRARAESPYLYSPVQHASRSASALSGDSEWAQRRNSQGQLFFYNRTTGATSWTRPASHPKQLVVDTDAAIAQDDQVAGRPASSWSQYSDQDHEPVLYNFLKKETVVPVSAFGAMRGQKPTSFDGLYGDMRTYGLPIGAITDPARACLMLDRPPFSDVEAGARRAQHAAREAQASQGADKLASPRAAGSVTSERSRRSHRSNRSNRSKASSARPAPVQIPRRKETRLPHIPGSSPRLSPRSASTPRSAHPSPRPPLDSRLQDYRDGHKVPPGKSELATEASRRRIGSARKEISARTRQQSRFAKARLDASVRSQALRRQFQ